MRALGLAAVVASLCALANGPAAAVTWAPGLTLGARLASRTIAPQLGLGIAGGLWALEAFGRRRYEFYGPADRPVPLAPISDLATLGLERSWSERSRVALQGRYERNHDVLDFSERTVVSTGDAARWGGSVQGGLGRVEGSYRVEGWSYANPAVEARSPGPRGSSRSSGARARGSSPGTSGSSSSNGGRRCGRAWPRPASDAGSRPR